MEGLKGKIKAVIPVKGMRKTVGEAVKRSLDTSAQLSLAVELDAGEVLQLRERLVAKEKKVGMRVSVFDILALIFARAMKNVPILNASLIDNEIKIWEDVNLGIAIATEINEYEGGLYVPVVKKADTKSLFEISREIKDLTTKTRSGKLTLEDMQGSTVTISSVSFISPLFASTPILNQGEALIIQPGSIIDRPVVRNGQVVIRPIITISFTFDHRISDGLPLGKLTRYIGDYMQDPDMLL
jgi:pyruvate/2-oxoglutarate dehydrogenase complex dihydrolipoamide acyltransferase (E2) component